MKELTPLIRAAFLLLALFTSISLLAQISQGGTPASFSPSPLADTRGAGKVIGIPVDFNPDSLREEDNRNRTSGIPPRIGVNIPVKLDMNNSGEWIQLPGGQEIWRLSLSAKGALALILYYDQFYIPEGGRLFIYNQDKSHILGAYTEQTNTYGKNFATELIAGDALTIEYEKPMKKSGEDIARISISGIGYGYNYIHIHKNNKLRVNDSGDCMVNINCPEGSGWQSEKKGVAKVAYPKGFFIYYCSGTLVNNTRQDLTPYWLSAHHCYAGISENELEQMIFYFHYEHPGCENPDTEPQHTKTMVGASLLVDLPDSGMSDGALLRINQHIPDAYEVYYNGWDRSDVPAKSGVGIHHPKGDVKKISTFTSPARSAQWIGGGTIGAKNAHWNIDFVKTENGHSVPVEGSSGSPLFNQNGLVVGTLTGGNTACYYTEGVNLYGKLWYHWDQAGDTPNKQMKTYLDPDNSNVMALPGTNKNLSNKVIVNFIASKTEVFASEPVFFSNLSFGAKTFKWSFPGGTPSSSDKQNPPAVIYNSPGVYNATLVINEGTKDELTMTRTRYISVEQKTNDCSEIINISRTETGVSEFPLGMLRKQTLSASVYTAGELGNKPYEIKELTWFATGNTNQSRYLSIYIKETDQSAFSAETWTNEISGATLVYDGSIHLKNNNGEVTVKLDQPFQYGGQKNLKIMTRVVAANNDNFISSSVKYAEKTGAHMQWTTSGSELPATKGTVGNKRPNIKISVNTCPAIVPVANFYCYEHIVLNETCDDPNNFPAEGWSIEEFGDLRATWHLPYQSPIERFDEDNPDNNSIVVFTPSEGIIDSWLKSPEVEIPAGAIIEFYLDFFNSPDSKNKVTFNISTDNGKTWRNYWDSTSEIDENATVQIWRKYRFDLSEFSGKKIRCAWQIKTIDINLPYFYAIGFDNIKLYSADSQKGVQINAGESVLFNDLSQGPPVTWEWSFPGGIPSSATIQHPRIKYTQPGVYDVTLKVKSNLGDDTKVLSRAVTVVQVDPEAGFIAERGYTRMSNYGKYIPVGAAITFKDMSKNFPDKWKWKFEGATPASSDASVIDNVVYNTKGEFDVSLTVSHTGGENTFSASKHTLVGDPVEKIWNMSRGDEGNSLHLYDSQYITGTMLDNIAIAEYFPWPLKPVGISRIDILFYVGPTAKGELKVSIRRPDAYGYPGELMGESILQVKDINPSGYTTVRFEEPIGTYSGFFVMVSGMDSAEDVAIYSSKKMKGRNQVLTQFTFPDAPGSEYWFDFAEAWGFGISLNIVPSVNYATLNVKSEYVYKKDNNDTSSETIQVESNVQWKAETKEPWIEISNSRGEGNGAFGFSCKGNSMRSRTGIVIVEGGGYSHEFTVTQAGPAVSDLKAVTSESSPDRVDLTWTAPVEETYIWEDFEGYKSFEINPPGKIGWSYIDADGDETTISSDVQIPYAGTPMAYMILNPYETNPPLTQFFNKVTFSGTKCLMALGASWVPNNDWIISPKLNFLDDFIFSFQARSLVEKYNKERIRVAYSTTGNEMKDFVHILTSGDYAEVSYNWEEIRYTIPKTAKYVAINCVSDMSVMLLIDDIYIGREEEISMKNKIGKSDKESTSKILLPDHHKEKRQNNPSIIGRDYLSNVQNNKKNSPFGAPSVQGMSIKKADYNITPGALNEIKNVNSPAADTLLRWGNMYDFSGALGGTVSGRYQALVKWLPIDMMNYSDLIIKSIEVYIGDLPETCTLKIWNGNRLLVDQPVEISSIGHLRYNTITLNSPLSVDVNKELIVGLDVKYGTGKYIVGLDKGPNVKRRSFYFHEETGSLFDLKLYDSNWHMGITAGVNYRKENKLFNVYRNNQLIVSDLVVSEFTDNLTGNKSDICYTVGTIYKNKTESTKSNASCINVTAIGKVNTTIATVYPNPFDHLLNIKSESGIRYIEVTDLSGRTIYNQSFNNETDLSVQAGNWGKGTYIMVVRTNEGNDTFKIIKN